MIVLPITVAGHHLSIPELEAAEQFHEKHPELLPRMSDNAAIATIALAWKVWMEIDLEEMPDRIEDLEGFRQHQARELQRMRSACSTLRLLSDDQLSTIIRGWAADAEERDNNN